ncbi:helix-turn-helix transcriptional regulator [Peribacillus simplex]|uniref:Transcriptional regulator n=2 Tax=Peribacillus simplex TaxID=1478 RepID=A0A8B5XTF6_9BACI|nr:helix-turn-helix transcriptional regulator [Peribacillus simplex]MEC1400770.1 helix-turn-helix transcriptional regulator [Peribacillus simplex]MED3912808.1 helix-turn-helix transcriptional regulator [Peribacillus simplex]TVX75783.1 transcriptional regulator [Peribacillus simplex]
MMKLGKKRSNFGRWVDKQKDINKLELERASNLSRMTISKLCSDPDYRPRFSTVIKINQGLKKLGKNMDLNDFFY